MNNLAHFPPPRNDGTQANLPPSYNLNEFRELEFPEHAEIIGERILPVNGKFIIGAVKGVGKTIFLGQLANELACGAPALGLFDIPEPKRVMIIQKEVADIEFRDRLDQQSKKYKGHNPENIIVMRTEDVIDIKLDSVLGVRKLFGIIERDKPEVLMLDPMVWFHNIDEDKAKDVKIIFDPLNEAIVKFNIAIMVSHHLKKPSNDYRGRRIMQTMFDFRGSGLWVDWADTVIWMNELAADRVLCEMFMRHGRQEPPTLVMARNRKFATFDCEVQDHPTDMAEYTAVQLLNQKPNREMKYDDLFDALIKNKVGPRQARFAISQLKEKNLAYFIGTNGDRIVRLLTAQSKVWLQ